MNRKKLFALMLIVMGLFGISDKTEATKLDLPINTISGSVYQDINENGVMELSNIEMTVSNQQVSIYSSLVNAVNNQQPIKTAKTNGLGTFSFTSLKRGTYYLRYNFDSNYRPINFNETAILDNGNFSSGIVKVEITNQSKILYTINLPVKRVTSLDILPFDDKNWNGLMDQNESIINGKTMIIIDLKRFSEMLKGNELATIDTTNLLLNSLSGDLDIADAIHFRTTKDGKVINLPDVSSGLYIIIRSPFNLTLSSLTENSHKVSALLEILQGGDVTGILNNPDLISTGDIDTNSDNEYIKLLASVFPKIASEIDKMNYEAVIGEDNSATVTATTSQLRTLGKLVESIPAMRFAKVDYFGHSYDLTGLKFKKTNQFLFGIKQYASIVGSVYNDTNLNGKKDLLEGLKSVDLTIYDAQGMVLSTTKSPTLYGEYELSRLPYGQPVYLGVSNDLVTAPELVAGKPTALADKKIIGSYTFERTAESTKIKQDIGISTAANIGFKVKSTNSAASSVVGTFSNTNSAALTVFYSVNDGEFASFQIKAKGLLAKESVQDIPLNNLLASGENKLTMYWTNQLYMGPLMTFSF